MSLLCRLELMCPTSIKNWKMNGRGWSKSDLTWVWETRNNLYWDQGETTARFGKVSKNILSTEQNRTLYNKQYLELNKDLLCLGLSFHLGLPISLEITFLKSSLHLSHPASWSVCVPTHLSLSLSLCNNNHLPGETVGWWAGRVALCSPEWKWTEHSTDKLLLVWPGLHCCGSSHSGSLGPKYIML